MRTRLLGGAVAVVILTNASIALHTYRNRGAVTSELWLTERELQYFPARDDGGEPRLLLMFAGNDYGSRGSGWLDERLMAELGFDAQPGRREGRWREPGRPAYVVFELGGAAREQWQQARLQQVEELRGQQPGMRGMILRPRQVEQASALVPVAAGREAGPLAARYRDRARFAILPSTIRWEFPYWPQPATAAYPQTGRIHSVLSAAVALPDEYRAAFQKLGPMSSPAHLYAESGETPKPRYRVRVRWGALYEPWITGVEMTP